MAYSQAVAPSAQMTEADIRKTVQQYFDCFNQKAFAQAAALFSQEGQLKPPFDDWVVGSDAIAQYLQQKAQNMTAFPQHWQVQRLETDSWQLEVTGQVRAIAFKVNIAWHFIVNAEGTIDRASIKLLASPKELLGLREAV